MLLCLIRKYGKILFRNINFLEKYFYPSQKKNAKKQQLDRTKSLLNGNCLKPPLKKDRKKSREKKPQKIRRMPLLFQSLHSHNLMKDLNSKPSIQKMIKFTLLEFQYI